MLDKLPKGWIKTSLGEILPLRYGKARSEYHGEHRENTRVFGSSGVVGHFHRALTSGPALIVGRKGNVGSIYYSDEPCWPIDTVFFSEATPDLNLPFFKYLLEPLDLKGLDRSTAVPGLSRDDYNRLEVGIPPLKEQERVVAKLDALLSGVAAGEDKVRRALGRLKRYRAAVLRAAVMGELTRDWREAHKPDETGMQLLKRLLHERRAHWEETQLKRLQAADKPLKDIKWQKRYPEPLPPNTTKLPNLPKGWAWASVDQMAAHEPRAITDGPFGSNLKSSHYTKFGPRVIRLENIGDGVFIDEKAHVSRKHYEFLKDYAIYPGDLVICALGFPAPRVCKIPDIGPAIVKADCIRFKVAEDFIESNYVLFALNSPTTRHLTENKIHGVGRPRLNLGEIKSIPLPLPPYAEQNQIAREVERRLAASERLAVTLNSQLNRARVTRQSLLQEAFDGRLVAQNPNDEPASALLDRIRAARVAEANKPRPKRMLKSKITIARRSILEVLREYKKPITPEQLFREARFQPNEVDSFYRELASLRKVIHERKPNGAEAKTWPHRAKVLVKLKED